MSYRMFVYAYSEATEIKGHELQAEKLRMCIASLSERLGGSDGLDALSDAIPAELINAFLTFPFLANFFIGSVPMKFTYL
ncbi:MAG: hypothetical protein P8Y36_09325 [Alphaproteobacteria bacterium]